MGGLSHPQTRGGGLPACFPICCHTEGLAIQISHFKRITGVYTKQVDIRDKFQTSSICLRIALILAAALTFDSSAATVI